MTFPVRVPLTVTVNTTGSPSLAAAFAMDRAGPFPPPSVSLSVIVPVAVPFARVAPLGLVSLTLKVSVRSSSVSSVVGTENV